MPTTEQQSEESKSLSQLIAGALMEVSPETAQSIAEHPDSPALVKRVQQVLGLDKPTDVMSPQERLRYLQAVGEEVIPTGTQQTAPAETDADTANRARLQAISDMALEAQRLSANKRDPSSPAPKKQEGMLEGLTTLLKKSLEESLTETKSDLKVLKDVIIEDYKKRNK